MSYFINCGSDGFKSEVTSLLNGLNPARVPF